MNNKQHMVFQHWLALSALIAAGILLWSLKEVILLIFAGVVIAMSYCTLVGKLRSKFDIPRPFALFICIITLLSILSLFLIVVVPPFTEEFQQIIIQLPTAARELWDLAIKSFKEISDLIYGNYSNEFKSQNVLLNGLNPIPDGSTLATGVGDGIKKLIGLAGNLGTGLIKIIFVLAVSLMVAIQPIAYREALILLVPSFYRRRSRFILKECGNALSNWMSGVLISSFCVALLAGIGLSLLGVKLVIANALLAGLLNFIPNVGPVISTIFPMSVALLEAPWKAAAVLGMYIIIQNLESYLITPSIMHHQVKLLPGLTLIAQLIFTIIFGPLGLFLALPLTVVIQVMIKEVVVHDLLDNWKKRKLA